MSVLSEKTVTPITQKLLFAERCLTPQLILPFMFYRLVYDIPSYLNALILAGSVLLQ